MAQASRAIQEEKLDSARYYFAQAEDLYLSSENWKTYIAQSLQLAAEMYAKRSFNASIQLLQHTDTLLVAKGLELPDQMISIRYEIARGYNALRQPDLCMQYLNQNLQHLDTKLLTYAEHQNLLGVSNYRKNAYLDALASYNKALTIRIDSLGYQSDEVALVFNNMGNTYSKLGLYSKALHYLNQSLEIRQNLSNPDERKITYVIANLGIMYKTKGEYQKAIQYFEQALDFFMQQPEENAYFISIIYNYLAQTYRYKGAYDEANTYHQKALEVMQQVSGDHLGEIAAIYSDWAILHGVNKNFAQEIAMKEKAVSLYQQILEPKDPVLLVAENNLGMAYLHTGQYNQALSQFQGIVHLLEEDEGQHTLLTNIYNNLGDVYLQQTEPNIPEAKNYHQKALAIQQELFEKKSYALAYTYNSLAKVAEQEGEKELALNYLQRALEANHTDFIARSTDDLPSPDGFFRYDYFVESLLHMAGLLQSDSDQTSLLRAKTLYDLVDVTLNQVRNELISAEDKIRLSEQFYDLSQAAIANCIKLAEVTGEQHYLEEAFAYSEKSKGNVMAQSMAANQATAFAGLPDSLIVLEHQLQSDINFYKLQLADQPDSLEAVLYQDELFTAQTSYRELITQLERNYPAYYQLKYETSVPAISSIQLALPASAALVNYLIGDSVLYSFVITQNEFSVHRSPIDRARFYDQQVAFRRSITRKLSWDYAELGYELYNLLFPFTLDKSIQTLVLIPDGTLNKLPFEALLVEKIPPETKSFSELHYLVKDYGIQYALSATLFHREKTSSNTLAKKGTGLMAYAPVFAEPKDIGYFGNNLRNPLVGFNEETSASGITDGTFITSLPGTADEVSGIIEIFKKHNQPAESFLFTAASEQQLKQSGVSRSRFLHIATHGLINEQQPELSGLILYPDSTEQEDHILYCGEIYNLSLCAELVVLSACETGLGKVAGGEGLLGLSRAFFYAGADKLLVSLWKVDDLATAALMKAFYSHLLERGTKAFSDPLRETKLELIGSEVYSHPYYWSAFILID